MGRGGRERGLGEGGGRWEVGGRRDGTGGEGMGRGGYKYSVVFGRYVVGLLRMMGGGRDGKGWEGTGGKVWGGEDINTLLYLVDM